MSYHVKNKNKSSHDVIDLRRVVIKLIIVLRHNKKQG